jgi:hypothetical protein
MRAVGSGSVMAICRKCGAQVRDGKAFCSNCGEAVNAAQAQEQQPEFLDTVTMPPPAQGATQTPTTAVGQPRPVVYAESVRRLTDHAGSKQRGGTKSEQEPRGFFSNRAWIVMLLVLLLIVLGFIVWAVLAD